MKDAKSDTAIEYVKSIYFSLSSSQS